MRHHRKQQMAGTLQSTSRVLGVLLAVGLATGCVTVRPEQRAVLADPTMQYDANALEEGARQHVLENREASFGGGAVQGGGCGCN